MRGRTGGFRVKAVHPLEGVLMEFYELDGASVHRLALFVLACTVVDQMVTILVTSSRLQSFPQILSGKGPLRLAKKIRKAKFAHRLKDARRFLSAMLKRMQAEIGELLRLRMRVDRDHPALFSKFIERQH